MIQYRKVEFYFTVSTGRCGQATLARLLDQHLSNAVVAFEEPQVNPRLPGPLGVFERRLRRRFLETDELLGRGKVLQAYENSDHEALARFGRARRDWINARVVARNARIYVDVSKHFIHGLHTYLVDNLTPISLIRLVRDPLQNMCSYLNRSKNFRKDNNSPQCRDNELVLDSGDLADGELYLWAWFETYLRFERLVHKSAPSKHRTIHTEDLNNAAVMREHLRALNLLEGDLKIPAPQNTNVGIGLSPTAPGASDVALFERFLRRIPESVLTRIDYLDTYDYRRFLS